MSTTSYAGLIDHTLLKPDAQLVDINRVCDEAIEYSFASVCVNGIYAKYVADRLKGSAEASPGGSPVKTCVVVGFPLGACKPMMAAIEATSACKDGADEIDFVAHLPYLLEENIDAAEAQFREVVSAARTVNPDVVVKVILETAALMHDAGPEKAETRVACGCLAARRAGCDFVKTSTGFHPAGGATPESVGLLKKHAGPMQVKASGGIRSAEDAGMMVFAGADRLGCSAGVAIVKGQQGTSSY